MKSLRIVFMGTPEFAVASLDALVNSEHQVVGVVTVADKPAGRGQQLSTSAVKDYAVRHELRLMQPVKLKDEAFVEELKSLNADLFVVVAFRMLPELVWTMPPLGTINLHGSLLPKYRGAAPINWAVINGEMETGVTTFFLRHEIDTGSVIQQTAIPIYEEDNAGAVHDRMMIIGAQTLKETVDLIAQGKATPISQDDMIAAGSQVLHAPKIFKEDCKIDWSLSVNQIHNKVRGLSPYPAAWTVLGDKTAKIFSGKKIEESHSNPVGSLQSDGKKYLNIACSDGYYSITELQYEGKKRMGVEEFLRGWRMPV
ncbi:MAG: methionyl-tRNA formyltransferase [Flavobacteriales bacterium]|jgi:methionyl-tRNA formyltransferase